MLDRRTFMASAASAGLSMTFPLETRAQAGATPAAAPEGTPMKPGAAQTGYAPVNGLEMYYEVHGSGGTPLVVLHGAYMSIVSAYGAMLPALASGRQVIATEFQGHGRTADIDRPITYEALADDVAALLDHLGIAQADVFGYSLGGGVAMQVAIRHPDRVRKLVAASAAANSDGYQPGFFEMIEAITPELFAGSPVEAEYRQLAPNPDDFPALVEKLKQLDLTPFDWEADVAGLTAPTLLVFGDNDVVTLEHAVEMYRLLGGGVNGDIVGLPGSRLLVLPGATHIGVVMLPELLLATIPPFLDTPMES